MTNPGLENTDPFEGMEKQSVDIGDRIEALVQSPDYTPEKLIDLFKEDDRVATLLAQPAVREGYSIEEHTLMVLRQFEKYSRTK